MARRYFITGEVANGEFVSEEMSGSYEGCQLAFITFYSDEYITQSTPTAGTVEFSLSADGFNYKTVSSGSFNAAQAYTDSRTPPNAAGLAVRAKITLSGVNNSTHFKACVWRV